MPIDQTMRGLALEIDASTDPAPETQPLLEYRFINLAGTQTILARIKGIPRPEGGGHLAFETNAGADTTTQRMLIDDKGNVGIGSENPEARLDVAGDARFSGPLSVEGALTTSGAAKIGGDLSVTGKLTAASFAGDGTGLSNITPADNSVTNAKLSQDAASLSKVTEGEMIISGGNVGVGTANPTSKLHILSGASDVLPPRLEASANTSFAAGWDFYHEATPKGYVGVPGSATGIAPGEMLLFGSAGTKLSLWAGANRSVTLDTNGNVGIGTTNPTHRFHVLAPDAVGLFESTGTQAYLRLTTREGLNNRVEITNRPGGRLSLWTPAGDMLNITKAGLVGIGTIAPNFNLDVAGSAHASSFPTSSDARFKTNVTQVSGVLEKLKNVRAVFFEWNELYTLLGRSTGKREIGVVAQEIEAVFPELVTEWGDQNYKALDYGRLAAVLLEAVKELATQTEILSRQVRDLQKTSPAYSPNC